MDSNSLNVLRKQKKLFAALVLVLLFLSLLIFHIISEDNNFVIPNPSISKASLPGDTINPHEIWLSRIENDNKLMSQKLSYLESLILETKKNETEKEQENQDLKQQIATLKKELKEVADSSKTPPVKKDSIVLVPPGVPAPFLNSPKPPSSNLNSFSATNDPFIPTVASREHVEKPKVILREVTMGKSKRNISHVDKEIPAGTTVKALLVSSIDAACGVFSNSDPQPVKLRILDDGHLPKEVTAKLRGGLIIASAYGDISTERVYMRIERLTKVEPNGEFIETGVTGFVSGEDGKFGVRGTVVDKSEKIVANAAKSGFLGGIGNILQSAVARHSVNQYSFDVVKQGCASGAASAFDMLADYYIKRAEQVKPVIQVTAGRTVDVTFTHKASIGDLYTKEQVKEIREKSRRENG